MICILILMVALICGIAFIWKMSAIAKEERIVSCLFPIGGLKKPLNIFFISDIHRRTVSSEIIEKVKEQKVKLVFIGGDLAEEGVSFQAIEDNIKRLSSLGKTYFVWGNNDYEVDQERLSAIFEKYGVTALRNESVLYDHDGEVINICGVDDIRLELDDYQEAVRRIQKEAPTLLLSHNPAIHHQIQETDGIDAVFSGHTHGGQIRIGRLGFYEKGGTGTVHKAYYLISNGYGTTKLPLRLGARPETHLIKLVPKHK
ncbi:MULTISPECIES: metallophosphoesterase [unclassified Bacillus (in: firmicutes)]|uniref:metallophosphoesterase n=2 Tax=Bacillus TaxID=1386 RepID=UPI00041365EF|nr:metallophosphoesterase [Bacillus sp. HSf4]QHZ47456.1 metallophosphoesterase [Bacillus sp. NSP9.1]WFA03512.1 metallophosphoesterase [Bacillus sp. HSf4]